MLRFAIAQWMYMLTLKFVIPGVSSDHWIPTDVLLTLNADTLRPTPTQINICDPHSKLCSFCFNSRGVMVGVAVGILVVVGVGDTLVLLHIPTVGCTKVYS